MWISSSLLSPTHLNPPALLYCLISFVVQGGGEKKTWNMIINEPLPYKQLTERRWWWFGALLVQMLNEMTNNARANRTNRRNYKTIPQRLQHPSTATINRVGLLYPLLLLIHLLVYLSPLWWVICCFPRETVIQDIPKHEFSLFLRKLKC